MDEYDKRKRNEAELNFERMKYNAWLSGLYVQLAVGSCLSKKCKYPKEPFGEDDVQDAVIEVRENATQEEIVSAEENFFERIMILQRQAELADGSL